ncbi:hypothetical protein ACSEE7_20040 [Halomonas cupida]|uniref:hypothetical protein n=1 Tax=Halomonas cupida TaxID=44933 RepID=UPI003EF27014|tara:strand:- start:747 stop:1160 length:414 start_codon:yes stop_codon:yes gene_type:complete
MKRYTTLIAATMLGLFSTASFAVTGSQPAEPIVLEAGVSDSQLISQEPRRYKIQVSQSATLELSSEHQASDSSENVRIQGRLYDAEGNLVAQDSDLRGHFLISEQVAPGTYILEVSGNAMGSPDEVANRYNLHVNIK